MANRTSAAPQVVIRDAKLAAAHVEETRRMSATYTSRLHVDAVSVLYHTAAHRQLDPDGHSDMLHRFYDGLSRAYQDVFKQYVREHCLRKVKTAEGIELKGWITYRKKSFYIVKKDEYEPSVEMSEAFVANIDTLAADKPFYAREGSRESPAFVDASILKRLENTLARAKTARDDGTVSQAALELLAKAVASYRDASAKAPATPQPAREPEPQPAPSPVVALPAPARRTRSPNAKRLSKAERQAKLQEAV
jgi:hypothetical protein